jgi:hypothetical protein
MSFKNLLGLDSNSYFESSKKPSGSDSAFAASGFFGF